MSLQLGIYSSQWIMGTACIKLNMSNGIIRADDICHCITYYHDDFIAIVADDILLLIYVHLP